MYAPILYAPSNEPFVKVIYSEPVDGLEASTLNIRFPPCKPKPAIAKALVNGVIV